MNFFLYELLPTVLNMSIVAGYVIIFVLIARLLLKKAPKIFSYLLWAVVLIRLLCPFAFESAIGLLPSNTEPIPQDIVYAEYPSVDLPFPTINEVINESLPQGEEQLVADPLEAPVVIGTLIWALGVSMMVIYSIVSLIKLRRKIIGATPLAKGIYIADHIDSPFVLGLIKPKIYLPSNLTQTEQEFIISHEQTHIKRLDHITRILAFIALSFHWFNPLVWLAFVLSAKDMEISCDESVIKKMDTNLRADYSEALLKFATTKKLIAATPLAFGEGDTKGRVKNVLKYKKPMIWLSAICLVLVGIIAVALMSNNRADTIENDSVVYITETLWQYRTEYVGDNAAVGNIISNLSLPQDVYYENFSLDTDQPPFGLTVNLITDEFIPNLAEGDLSGFAEKSSVVLFSLIGNVDNISFNFSDGYSMSGITFYRQDMESIYGEDLFSQTETLEEFDLLFNEIFDENYDAPLYEE